jgi:hypothetical protein
LELSAQKSICAMKIHRSIEWSLSHGYVYL